MEDEIQKKIIEILTSVTDLNASNVFYLQSAVDTKLFPRCIFSEVSSNDSYDTEGAFIRKLVQISLFDVYKSAKVIALKAIAEAVKEKMVISEFAGMNGFSISRCKKTNTRESVIEGIFNLHLTFQMDFSVL